MDGKRRRGGRIEWKEKKEGKGGSREGGREGVTNVGAGGEGVMKSRASYVGTSAQPCSTCEVTTPVDVQCPPFHVSPPTHPHPPLTEQILCCKERTPNAGEEGD